MKYRRFEDIPVWQQARQFLNRIYGICGKEKFKNNYELLDQVRRAGISIMLNIAEGFERKTNKEFARFINIAKASAGEIRCGLYIALDLKYISIGEFNELFSEITSIGNQLSRFEIYLLETHKK